MTAICIILGIVGYVLMTVMTTVVCHILECNETYSNPEKHYHDMSECYEWLLVGFLWPITIPLMLIIKLVCTVGRKLISNLLNSIVDLIEIVKKWEGTDDGGREEV